MSRHLNEVDSEFELRLDELPTFECGAVRWDRVFGTDRPLRVEVGVGNSPFLIEVARRAPGFNYVGFEYSGKRVVKFLKKVRAADLNNIRILRMDASRVMGRLFSPESVDHFYINHPDPWPKRRHAKHRFVRAENVETMVRLLAPGGSISLRTDATAYAEQMLALLDSFDTLENLAGEGSFAPTPREPIQTPYEIKFREQGKAIYYLEHRKAGADSTH